MSAFLPSPSQIDALSKDKAFLVGKAHCFLPKGSAGTGVATQASCLAVMAKDKQDKPGWRALKWLEAPA